MAECAATERSGNTIERPTDDMWAVHERIATSDGRTIKIDYYGNAGTFHIGIAYPGADRAKVTSRITAAQARETAAGLYRAAEAIENAAAAYHARNGDG